jgi:hypothetical protein
MSCALGRMTSFMQAGMVSLGFVSALMMLVPLAGWHVAKRC